MGFRTHRDRGGTISIEACGRHRPPNKSWIEGNPVRFPVAGHKGSPPSRILLRAFLEVKRCAPQGQNAHSSSPKEYQGHLHRTYVACVKKPSTLTEIIGGR